MKEKNGCLRTRFSTILWSTLAILLCAAPAVNADETVPAGQTWYINYAVTGILWVYGTADLLTGASVSQSIYVQIGGTLNMYSGTVGLLISVSPGADVTVYGTDFAVSNGTIEPNGYWNPYGIGTLTGYYEDTTQINLSFYTDTPIHLQPPPSGGPEEITIDIKPGSYPNSINLRSKGVVPVAIFSDATFDATAVNPARVFFAGAGVAVRGKGNKYLVGEEDVNGDGLLDLVVKVETENLDPDEFAEGGAYLRVHETSDNVSPVLYEGWDEIKIVPR